MKLNLIQGVCGVAVLFSGACGGGGYDGVGTALDFAGENREHLEATLRHFEGNPQRLAAAEYIIAGMPLHNSESGVRVDAYKECLHLYSQYRNEASPMIDSIQQSIKDAPANKIYNDARTIDSTYLINSIESAFRLRETLPWCAGLTDEEFNRYVLPYRVGNEELTYWRDSIMTSFRPVIDSLISIGCTSRLEAANALLKKWGEKSFRWSSLLPTGPSAGLSNVYDKVGSCIEFAHGAVYLMRGAGIPAGVDMVSVKGNNNASHYWAFMIDENGENHAASIESARWNPVADFFIRGGKILRQEYGLNDSLAIAYCNKVAMPELFATPMFRDVTALYKPTTVRDLKFKNTGVKGAPVYLAMTSRDNWVAVDACGDGADPVFRDVNGGVVASLCVWRGGRMAPVSSPFYIPEDQTEIRYLDGKGEEREITLFAKFPFDEESGDLVYRMPGGMFEGADSRDFSDSDTLWVIPEFPRRKETVVRISEDFRPHRYYRYLGADSTFCNVAEVAFYDSDGRELKGRVIGSEGSWKNDTTCTFEKVFDGNHYTSFDYSQPSGGWAGIDCGKPESVGSIMYVPRNRDNFVREGDEYELFYFRNNNWKSAGRMMAESDSLSFTVPSGALYFLRNHTRGKNERVFEYDFDGRNQIFR